MRKICDVFIEKSSIKVFIISTIIFIIFMVLVLPKVSNYTEELTGTSSSPDTSIIYSSSDLFDIADTYGEEGRNAYIVLRLSFDVVWPIVYFIFVASVTGVLLKSLKLKEKYNYFMVLPIFSIIFDYLENMFSIVVMYKYPIEMNLFASIAPVMTLLKWIFLGSSFIIIIILLVTYLIKKDYKRIS